MELKPSPKTAVITFFLFLFVICCYSVQPRKLAGSPSPAPATIEEPNAKLFIRGSNGKVKIRGSMPASCRGRCLECRPCLPVEISVRGMEMEMEEYEYYPLVWKCMCNHNMFSP